MYTTLSEIVRGIVVSGAPMPDGLVKLVDELLSECAEAWNFQASAAVRGDYTSEAFQHGNSSALSRVLGDQEALAVLLEGLSNQRR